MVRGFPYRLKGCPLYEPLYTTLHLMEVFRYLKPEPMTLQPTTIVLM
jgi:hypothetical protein